MGCAHLMIMTSTSCSISSAPAPIVQRRGRRSIIMSRMWRTCTLLPTLPATITAVGRRREDPHAASRTRRICVAQYTDQDTASTDRLPSIASGGECATSKNLIERIFCIKQSAQARSNTCSTAPPIKRSGWCQPRRTVLPAGDARIIE